MLFRTLRSAPRRLLEPIRSAGLFLLAALFVSAPAMGQSATDWFTGALEQTEPGASDPGQSTLESREPVLIRTRARLTADGDVIDQVMAWRVFGKTEDNPHTRLLQTQNEASPTFRLRPGDYIINVALGRAHITRRITVRPAGAEPPVEDFVLNAGGLRVRALVDGEEAQANAASYAIYTDRDQTDARNLVVSAVRPGGVIRLNAGIYHIVSTYGDCNAVVSTDVTVEAGKLTDVAVAHSAAKATFKLVPRAGGEALPDTQWSIQTPEGEVVKTSVGALPTHILAPGSYTVVAKSQGRAFQREISLGAGDTTQVEVVMR